MPPETAPLQTIALPMPFSLSEEDQARADFYALIARLLLAPPNAALLAALGQAEPVRAAGLADAGRALEDAWLKLTQAASVMDADAVAEEFAALFVSTGNPLISPNASFYLAGHLNDVPLAALRQDLARLGIARAPGVGEFEDHLGALCETMRVLIAGAQGIARQSLDEQQRFFTAHVRPWYAACVAHIAGAEPANFYRVVAAFAGAFLGVEALAFAMWQGGHDDAEPPIAA